MRPGLFILVLLTSLFGLRTGSAQLFDFGEQLGGKPQTKGFDWFFAHVKRPTTACDGDLVVATWYATGRRTANGDVFDVNRHAAAHRTLPFGSRVTVTNPHNGKSVIIVINDRGPFVKGVTLDLTRGAARAIGMGSTQWVCMTTVAKATVTLEEKKN